MSKTAFEIERDAREARAKAEKEKREKEEKYQRDGGASQDDKTRRA